MPAALKVKLSLEEDKRLLEISQMQETGKRVKQRAEAIRLSGHGWKVAQIAAYFEWHEQTVREIIQRWKRDGEKGLYDLPKTGRPKQWQEEDLKYLETCLEKDGQVYNSKQLAVKLEQERQVKLSSDRIRKLLKKKGWVWKRARISHRDKQNQETKAIKQADLDFLQLAAAAGEIYLKYLDETGFSCWSPVQYGWIRQGQSKRLEQTALRGKRVSLIGVLEPEVSFDAAYRVGSITSKEYIQIMDRQADLAADLFLLNHVITVIAQDNSSTHTCKAVQLKIPEWERKGLFLFQLPPYCSEMNPIELEWLHLKRDHLSGQMFDSEDNLMWGIEDALHSRYDSLGFDTSYFEFSYA